MYEKGKPERCSVLTVWEIEGMMITDVMTYNGNDCMLFGLHE